jgi:predicted nucleic acid-binding protein
MALPFLDTNIFLRHLRQDDPVLSSKATAIFRRIEQEDLRVHTSETVVFETVFALQRFYKQPRDRISDAMLSLLELTNVVLPRKRIYRKVFALYRESSLGFADCYHVVLMEQLKTTEILSFDTDFDRIPGIVRREE